jgi:hypothetical protein
MTIKNVSDATLADLEAEILRRKTEAMQRDEPPVIVRAYSGVFFGYLLKQEGAAVELRNARQIWSWDSAGLTEKVNTCPDIAARGVGTGSKVSSPASRARVEQVGAMFFATLEAEKNICAQKWATR